MAGTVNSRVRSGGEGLDSKVVGKEGSCCCIGGREGSVVEAEGAGWILVAVAGEERPTWPSAPDGALVPSAFGLAAASGWVDGVCMLESSIGRSDGSLVWGAVGLATEGSEVAMTEPGADCWTKFMRSTVNVATGLSSRMNFPQ